MHLSQPELSKSVTSFCLIDYSMAFPSDLFFPVLRIICYLQRQKKVVQSKKKSISEDLFWCFRLSQIEDSIEYQEGPNSTWKDHDRNLGVQAE